MALTDRGWPAMGGSANSPLLRSAHLQDELFPLHANWIGPEPQGKDISFFCRVSDGRSFYCKGDAHTRPTRALEAVFTSLARELGISTAPWSAVEFQNETYFGSEHRDSTSSLFDSADYITRADRDEIGKPLPFPGAYLSQLYTYDLFISNPDRGTNNFILLDGHGSDRLCAIDFADASFNSLMSTDFPVAQSKTRKLGRRCRGVHGDHLASAFEMIERIEGLPKTVFSRIVNDIRDDWMTEVAKGSLCEIWGSAGFKRRLALLRAGLANGDLV